MKHISLFAGIGGDTLAAEWAGFETVLFVENDKFCQKVLNKHWPNVPIIGDIRDATKERIQEVIADTISNGKVGDKPKDRQRRGTKQEGEIMARGTKSNRGQEVTGVSEGQNSNTRGVFGTDRRPRGNSAITPVTLITGGFPCQPVSHAGKRKGKADDRWLWPEMLRVISEIRPDWVVAENVAGFLTMGFNYCVSDLESEGYETIPFLIPACAVNAPHRRDRIFIIAFLDNSTSTRYMEQSGAIATKPNSNWKENRLLEPSSQDVAYTEGKGLEGADATRNTRTEGCFDESRPRGWDSDWWATEPELGRVAYGIPNRVDRLKALGNAIVPQQIYPILKGIANIENKRNQKVNKLTKRA